MKKNFLLGFTILIIYLCSNSTAFAFEVDTIIIGNKAFELDVLGDSKYDEAVQKALDDLTGSMYYSIDGLDDGAFKNLDDQTLMTDEEKEVLKNIQLRKADGSLWNYATFDTTEPTKLDDGDVSSDFKVEEIY